METNTRLSTGKCSLVVTPGSLACTDPQRGLFTLSVVLVSHLHSSYAVCLRNGLDNIMVSERKRFLAYLKGFYQNPHFGPFNLRRYHDVGWILKY